MGNSKMNHVKRRRKRRVKTTLLTATLMGALVVGSIMAYLIDVDSKDGVFQFGSSTSIDISLVEEKGSTGTHKNVMPNETYVKDPAVLNEGTSAAYVFMQVEVPTAFVETVDADGTKTEAAETELFNYEVTELSGWTLIGDAFTKSVKNGATIENYVVYTYVYGTEEACQKLDADSSTSTLFDEVNVVNYVGGNEINGKQKDLVVTAYAIQTTGLDSTKPEEVWPLLATQAGAAIDIATE